MIDRIQAAKVGALVIAAIIAGVFFFRTVSESSSSSSGRRVYALFDDAQGLITKSRVTVAGITVGRIENIRLDPRTGRARVDMTVDVPLFDDASVLRRSASLLGEYLLVINPGTTGHPRIPDGGQIQNSESSPTMNDVMAQLAPTMGHIRAVAAQLERSFGTDVAGQQMQDALRNLSEGLETMNEMLRENQEAVRGTISNVEGITERAGPRLDEILANVENITNDVESIMENNREDIDNGVGEVDDTIASIRRASEQLEVVLADLGEVTERTAAGEGTIGRLTSDEHLIDEVETSVDGISDFLGGITRLRTVVQLRSEYNFIANTFKNYFSARVLPREGRYFLVELVDDPRGRTRFSSVQVRRSPGTELAPEFYEEERVETFRDFNFTLQLAQRIHFLTFRFGIMESTGGFGVDLNFFDERLEINADLFGFSLSRYPRLRTRVSFEVIRTLWILAGADDVFNERTFDFFVGAQLRFDDLDLPSLIPFLGGAVAGN